MSNDNTPQLPEPQTGGRYRRLPGGKLHQVHETKPADGRVESHARREADVDPSGPDSTFTPEE